MRLALKGDVRAAILDVDGTLVDSNDLHAESWVETLRYYGQEVAFSRVRPFIGMGDEPLLRLLGGDPSSHKGISILSTRKDLFVQRYLPGVKPFPRVGELLARMREEGLELAVASPSDDQLVALLLEKTGASELVRKRLRSPEGNRSGSYPDRVKTVLSLLQVRPRQAAMLGDTPYDEEAALAANIAFVGLRSGGWSNASFMNAAALYENPAELLERFEMSPFSNR
jgi:phosphoglycolate phosphatase-like HAD superfamily hydrolase